MQPPSRNPGSPTSKNANPDLGTACPPKRYVPLFVPAIVQKSRRDGLKSERSPRQLHLSNLRRSARARRRRQFPEVRTGPISVRVSAHRRAEGRNRVGGLLSGERRLPADERRPNQSTVKRVIFLFREAWPERTARVTRLSPAQSAWHFGLHPEESLPHPHAGI
jgi:hypothetical protein